MRPIDADALKNAFEEDGHMSGYIEEFIDAMTTLDVAPVVHGRWQSICNGKVVVCSECKAEFDNTCNFDIQKDWNECPNCGAAMDKED